LHLRIKLARQVFARVDGVIGASVEERHFEFFDPDVNAAELAHRTILLAISRCRDRLDRRSDPALRKCGRDQTRLRHRECATARRAGNSGPSRRTFGVHLRMTDVFDRLFHDVFGLHRIHAR
jgi:hypothetical protein